MRAGRVCPVLTCGVASIWHPAWPIVEADQESESDLNIFGWGFDSSAGWGWSRTFGKYKKESLALKSFPIWPCSVL